MEWEKREETVRKSKERGMERDRRRRWGRQEKLRKVIKTRQAGMEGG